MVDLTEGFDDPAIGKATIIVAPPPGGFKGALDGLNCKEFRFMPQMLGRAWRPGRKPRLAWDAEMQCWLFDPASIERIRQLKPPSAMRYRVFEVNFNRINGTL